MTENILGLWLGEYPPHTVLFVRLLICVSLVEAVANPLMVGASATGNIKRYQLMVGGCMLCTVPVAYIALKMGAAPEFVFWALIATTLLAQCVRMWLCRKLFGFSIPDFCLQVMWPIAKVATACFVPLLMLHRYYIGAVGVDALLVCIALDVWVAACVFALGMNKVERNFILKKIRMR